MENREKPRVRVGASACLLGMLLCACGGDGDAGAVNGAVAGGAHMRCNSGETVVCSCPGGAGIPTVCGTTGIVVCPPCQNTAGAMAAPPAAAGAGAADSAAGASGAGTGGAASNAGSGGMPAAGSGGAAGSAAAGQGGTGGTGGAGGAAGMNAGSGGAGMGSAGMIADDDLDALRQLCVDHINMYRATLGLMPMQRASTEQEMCSDRGAQMDGDSGQAHGAAQAGLCRSVGLGGENTCPGWPVGGFSGNATLADALTNCLDAMWAEGEPPVSRQQCQADYAGCFLQHGHYLNMSEPNTGVVACGFYEMSNGAYWMNQDFGF